MRGYRKSDASPRIRLRPISGSGPRYLPSSGCLASSSGGAWSMTGLTWIPGSKNISAEDGPEGKLYGP
jgi:hypothetical protein